MNTITMPDAPLIRSKQTRRVRVGLAVAAGTAVAYGAARLVKHSRTRHDAHEMKAWLGARLGELSGALALTADASQKMTKEIRCASRMALKLETKSRNVKPEVGDLLRIVADKRLLKMKLRLHRMLDLSEASHANALRDFYEELHRWVFTGVAEPNTA